MYTLSQSEELAALTVVKMYFNYAKTIWKAGIMGDVRERDN